MTNISDRMSGLKPSAIREMLKVTADPSIISFAAGNPSSEAFPHEELGEVIAGIFSADPSGALQYSITEGFAPLRKLTADRLKNKYGIGTEDDDLIITSGGQQGIDLMVKCLVNEGDCVICENPSFIGALNSFRSYGANIIGIPMDNDGMDIDALERALKSNSRVKLIYTIPTFQNPTGITMSEEKRMKLLELAVRYDVMVLEDSPYFELAYDGKIETPIKTADTTGHVMYVGSYSKVIAPGIRIGFACGPKWLISTMTVAKQVSDVHTNGVFMTAVAKYLEKYDLDAHIERCRSLYIRKRDLMLRKIDECIDPQVRFTRPGGGLFIWGELPDGFASAPLCETLKSYKVAIVPGPTFDTREDIASRGFRLNFSVPSEEQIIRGIELLGSGIRNYLSGR